MGRLRSLSPAIATIAPRVKRGTDRQGHSRTLEPWRAWFNLKRWKQLRWSILVRDLFTCQMPGCGRIETKTSLLVADHKRPHRGDASLFWDPANLQCLCKTCHDTLKQREERRQH